MKTFAFIVCILLGGCSARMVGNYCLVGEGGIYKSLVYLDRDGSFQERCRGFECYGRHSFGKWRCVGRNAVELSSCSDSFGFEITQVYKSKARADSLVNIMVWYPGGRACPVRWDRCFKAESFRVFMPSDEDWLRRPDSLSPVFNLRDTAAINDWLIHPDSIYFTAYRKSNDFDSLILYRDGHVRGRQPPRFVALGDLPDTVVVTIDGPPEWYYFPARRYTLDRRKGLMMPEGKTEAQIYEERQYWVNFEGDSVNAWSGVLKLAKEAHASKKVFFEPVKVYCGSSSKR